MRPEKTGEILWREQEAQDMKGKARAAGCSCKTVDVRRVVAFDRRPSLEYGSS